MGGGADHCLIERPFRTIVVGVLGLGALASTAGLTWEAAPDCEAPAAGCACCGGIGLPGEEVSPDVAAVVGELTPEGSGDSASGLLIKLQPPRKSETTVTANIILISLRSIFISISMGE